MEKEARRRKKAECAESIDKREKKNLNCDVLTESVEHNASGVRAAPKRHESVGNIIRIPGETALKD